MQEKLENNGRMWNYGTFRTSGKQMQAVDGKQENLFQVTLVG